MERSKDHNNIAELKLSGSAVEVGTYDDDCSRSASPSVEAGRDIGPTEASELTGKVVRLRA